ncbi:MAG: hypothetical protein VX730_07155 [Pseudomonadota bacterium]|nr:hypothetical protein [Pseudomonadota bacterium]
MRNLMNTTAIIGTACHLALGADALVPQYEPFRQGSFMMLGDNIVALASDHLSTQEVYTPANLNEAA